MLLNELLGLGVNKRMECKACEIFSTGATLWL